MSILVDLMRNAVDSGYAVAAPRKPSVVREPDLDTAARAPHGHAGKAAGVTAVVVLAGAGALFATSAVQSHRGASTARHQQQELVQRAAAQTASTDSLASQDVQLRQQIASARDAALAGASTGNQLQATITRLELAVGGDPVTGPGLSVVLDDAAGGGSNSLGIIYDTDLQSVANALWSSGAEAIAINGQRLSSLSSIREAGDAILVNYRPLAPPYTVQAIGAPGSLPGTFAATETAHLYTTWSQIYGLRFTVTAASRLTLPSAANLAVTEAKPLDTP
jgi:uncharacterized protein YlxW (UPF0749 family)